MRVNKFNIDWQIVRTDARAVKDVDKKIAFVLKFLNKERNVYNYWRVHNWLKMTGVAYKGDNRDKFANAVAEIENNKNKYSSTKDTAGDLSKISTSDLQKVYKDLSKRKYGFQYKNTPKAHTEFIDSLKGELDKR
tara:strand:+ start:240 stop:644 length:405 start_codon:yes stop_codon:yes gene_type:complete